MQRLSIDQAHLQQLFEVIEPVFDNTVDPKPVLSLDFRWIEDTPDAPARSLHYLPLPPSLVSHVLAKWDMRSKTAVDELGYYLYQFALAAKNGLTGGTTCLSW